MHKHQPLQRCLSSNPHGLSWITPSHDSSPISLRTPILFFHQSQHSIYPDPHPPNSISTNQKNLCNHSDRAWLNAAAPLGERKAIGAKKPLGWHEPQIWQIKIHRSAPAIESALWGRANPVGPAEHWPNASRDNRTAGVKITCHTDVKYDLLHKTIYGNVQK